MKDESQEKGRISCQEVPGGAGTFRSGPPVQFHANSHLNRTSDYGQEFSRSFPHNDVTHHLRIYAGAAYRVVGLIGPHTSFGDSLIGISGFELYSDPFVHEGSFYGRGYGAFNLESRGINGFTHDEDIQAGLLFHRPGSYFQIRPAIDFYNGFFPMGDLLFSRDQYLSVGVYFDY
jgi:hypothetical protein